MHSQEIDRTEIARYLTPTNADIEDKFRLIAIPVLGKAQTDKVVKLILNMENVPDVRELMDALKPAR